MTSDFAVVFALYPRVTQLDFTGPFEIFARLPRARCVLASTDGGTIQGDGGITFSGVSASPMLRIARCCAFREVSVRSRPWRVRRSCPSFGGSPQGRSS